MKQKTELQKMAAGELFDPGAPEMVALKTRARRLIEQLNRTSPEDHDKVLRITRRLFQDKKLEMAIFPPFWCDYGFNISVGKYAFFNYGCVILDSGKVEIGRDAFLGPGVHIYAIEHPMDAARRNTGMQWGKPVRIGDSTWIGGKTVVCPGVTIGNESVIGAGSVVTKDIPPGVVAVGNPCRVIRKIESPEQAAAERRS